MIQSALFSRTRILLVVCKMEWRDGSLDNQAGTFESKDGRNPQPVFERLAVERIEQGHWSSYLRPNPDCHLVID